MPEDIPVEDAHAVTDPATPAGPARPDDPEGTGEFVQDYSRLGFRQLQALCKTRNVPADGTGPQLIEKLKADDAAKGRRDVIADDEFDLLADDTAEPEAAATVKTGGAGPTTPATQPPAGGQAALLPPAGALTPAMPAVTVRAAEGEPTGLPQAFSRQGRPNMTAKDGLVHVGESHGAAEVRAFRAEHLVYGDLTDVDHFRLIAETHAMAAAAGYTTKGGVTVGERVGFSADADGRRTAIYQVPLKRQQ